MKYFRYVKIYFYILIHEGIYAVYRKYLSDIGYVSNFSYKMRKESERISKIPPEKYPEMLKAAYERSFGYPLDLENPKTFNEKLQWLKLYDNGPIKTRLADKYAVREWVAEKIGSEYLVPLLGVWDKFDDIDFDALPDKFVLKANHGSGWNSIVTSKRKFDKRKARILFNDWMKTNYSFRFEHDLELIYKDIAPKIIAEEYLETNSGDLKDYKILCFNGEPEYILVMTNRFSGLNVNVFDLYWNKVPFEIGYPPNSNTLQKPDKLPDMIEIAKKLCKGFYHVRIDLYENNGKVYFGEMTFHGGSGYWKINPFKWNEILGQLIEIKK